MVFVDINSANIGYGKKTVISDLNLKLDKGVTALLGPNGAGKTTLMKAVTGAIHLQGGNITVSGKVGYLEQKFSTMGTLTVLRTVAYAAWAAGAKRKDCFDLAHAALQKVNLDEMALQRVRKLSGGQRQRLGVACSIVMKPDVIILDEPTVGLDPEQRVLLRRHLMEIANDTAVVVSTHIVDDVAHMADRILVINEGKVIFDGNLSELESYAHGAHSLGSSKAEKGYLKLIKQNREL